APPMPRRKAARQPKQRARSTPTWIASSPSAAGCMRGGAHESSEPLRLGLRAAGPDRHRAVLRAAGLHRPGAEPDRLRPLRAGLAAEPALRGLRQLLGAAAAAAVLEGTGQHGLFRRGRRAAVDRAVAGHGAAAAVAA